jgi:rhodanese-related sulfurtransferase
MPDLENTINNAKDKLSEAKDKLSESMPTPPSQQMPQSSAQALKQRLEWGEVAFTILDVRDRAAFNASRIMGAITMPMEDFPQRALDSLEPRREIYVYGENDEQSAQAANQLRGAGFGKVSELRGGLAAWKAIGGPTEGNAETGYDASSAEYNVKARLDKHAQVTSKNV